MAIRDKIITGGNGINFTKEVDGVADHTALDNDTYFYDLSVNGGMPFYKNATGEVVGVFGVSANGSIDTHSDVDTSTAAPNVDEVLAWDGSNWIPSVVSTGGLIGISDSSGIYTYYTTLALAFAAATSGQTIKLFSDILETTDVSLTLPVNVNLDLNGYKYTKTTVGGTNPALFFSNSSTNNIFNGEIICNGGGQGFYMGANNKVYCSGVKVRSDTNQAVFGAGATSEIHGVKAYSTGQSAFQSVKVFDVYGESTSFTIANCFGGVNSRFVSTGSICLLNGSSGTYENCIFDALANDAVSSTVNSSFINCKFYSGISYGFNITGGIVTATNCTIETEGFDAIRSLTASIWDNCKFKSNSSAITVFSSGANVFKNCSVVGVGGAGVQAYNNSEFLNCSVESRLNSANGDGYRILTGLTAATAVVISGGAIKIINAAANFIDVTSAAATVAKWSNLNFLSANVITNPINANVSQGITNLTDNQGNIVV